MGNGFALITNLIVHHSTMDILNQARKFVCIYVIVEKTLSLPVTIFTFSLVFLLSSKRPNTRSNHDIALSYLILSYLIFSHFKVTPSRRGKQIVLEYR